MGHGGVEFARFEGTVADAIEDRAKAEPLEEGSHAVRVLFMLGDDAGADQPPRLMGADADDLTRIFAMEMVKRVETRDAGNAGDEQRQTMAEHPVMIATAFAPTCQERGSRKRPRISTHALTMLRQAAIFLVRKSAPNPPAT